MVVLSKIYTRTGDDGTTALGTGVRVAKSHLRIEAYGTVDEVNASLGVVRTHLVGEEYSGLDQTLLHIQNDLFDLGADLCVPENLDGSVPEFTPLRILPEQVTFLENEIDRLNKDLSPLRSFILPGGHAGAAALHVSRTICRRAERVIVALSQEEGEIVSKALENYMNRLSDFLFVASRWVNKQSVTEGSLDILWQPGKNR